MHAWSKRLIAVLFLFASPLTGCGDDGPVTCGEVTCTDRQRCDESGAAPVCACRAAFVGAMCEGCAPGFEEGGGTCVPVTIDCSEDPCGVGGMCIRDRTAGDRCECLESYRGPTCAQCADGYQDNDGSGTCEPSCTLAGDLECDAGLVCVDDSGTAMCGCPDNSGGAGCLSCRAGHYRVGDGPCVPDCQTLGTCGAGQHCDDDGVTGGRCVCDAGRAAPSCTDCESGYTLDGASCVREAVPGQIISLAEIRSERVLASLDPDTAALTPLRALPAPTADVVDPEMRYVTRDPASGRVFLSVSREVGPSATDTMLVELLPDGTYETITDPLRNEMGFHPATGAVYATATFSDASGTYAAVVRVDVDAPGDAVEVGRIDVGRVVGFGAESVGGPLRIFARNAVLGGLYDVDTGTGAATLVLEVPESTEVDYSELRQLAFSSDGPRLLGRRAVSEEESYENRCREAARRFGYPDAATAPVTPATGPSGPTFGFEAPTTELRSSLSSGPEILASVSYGGGPGELVVASDNPDAFVCVLTFEAEMTLRFAATARFASGFLHSYRENVQAVVDPGFTPPAVPNFTIHVTRATPDADLSGRVDPDPSFLAHPELFRMFTHAAWESRKLDEIESNDPIPRDVLIRVDGSGALHIVAPLPSPVIALSGT